VYEDSGDAASSVEDWAEMMRDKQAAELDEQSEGETRVTSA
jgi:hypothetical protein